jgi:hypothetical protein
VPKPIARQLLEAWKSSEYTLERLLDETQRRLREELAAADVEQDRIALDCDITSLSRKLHGKQILTTSEAEALARTLNVTIAWVPDEATA